MRSAGQLGQLRARSGLGLDVYWLVAAQGSKLYKSPFEVSKLSESDEEDEDDY